MRFEAVDELWLFVGLAVLTLLLEAFSQWRRRVQLLRAGSPEGLARMFRSVSQRRRWFKAVLRSLSIVLIGLALAEPSVAGDVEWRQRGIDVVTIYDASREMSLDDVYPTRFRRALREGEAIQLDHQGDRVGVVLFGGGAVHVPLTHDTLALQSSYRGVTPADFPPGANLKQALRLATCSLRSDLGQTSLCSAFAPGEGGAPLETEPQAERAIEVLPSTDRARAVVLFSSGAGLGSSATEEAQLAESLGISFFVVGVAGAPLPALEELTAEARGRYFTLGAGHFDGAAITDELARLKRGDLDKRVVESRIVVFERFLFPAFLLLIMEACLSERRRRTKLPIAGRLDQRDQT